MMQWYSGNIIEIMPGTLTAKQFRLAPEATTPAALDASNKKEPSKIK